MRCCLPVAPVALALALACAPGIALGDQVYATASGGPSRDPAFPGLYEYQVEIYWDLPRFDQFTAWIDLPSFASLCAARRPVFPSPAGSAAGTGGTFPCTADFSARYLCIADPTIPFAHHGGVIRDSVITPGCLPLVHGRGVFRFFSVYPPAPNSLYRGAAAVQHNASVVVGDLFGALPTGPAPPPVFQPVIVNEFLVRPPAGRDEYVEILNRSSDAVETGGWTVMVSTRTQTSWHTFPSGSWIAPHAYQAVALDSLACPSCFFAPGILRPDEALAAPDLLFDAGGVISLRDGRDSLRDQVGYGNLGGAPISCPRLVVGRAAPGGATGAATTDTVATATARAPDGADTGIDAADFNLGAPSPDAVNAVAAPALGSSARLQSAYVYPSSLDPALPNDGVEFYNPLGTTVDLGDWQISDGYLIRPIFPPGTQAPLEAGQMLVVVQGLNGDLCVELDEDDRLDVYDLQNTDLVRIEQLGWVQIPSHFPDSCIVRSPPGSGPANGWDWNTSGGYVSLFYADGCGARAPGTPVTGVVLPRAELAPPWPNPCRGGTARLRFTVPGPPGDLRRVGLVLADVAGRRVRRLVEGRFPPGARVVSWDGRSEDGAPAPPGIYFVRLTVEGAPAAARTLVRLAP